MRKIIELDDVFPVTGEPTMRVLARSERGRWYTERKTDKFASSDAFDYVQSVQPRDGCTVVLVNALGTFEYYDANRNGDAFPERAYRVGERAHCGHPKCTPTKLDGWVSDDEVAGKFYKTFERAGIFKHHVNKDPAKTLGRVERAFWNATMHRIELLLEIRNNLDVELIRRINDGEFPAVSMGCHVRYDVCARCGHRAPSRKDYCEHALQLRKIDPLSGELNCVLNPSPDWFDISFVYRPADRTGFMLKKVAHEVYVVSSASLGEKVALYEDKLALARKLSDIQKEIAGEVAASRTAPDISLVRAYRPAVNTAPDLPDAAIDLLAEAPVSSVVSGLAAKNAALSASDFARLFLLKTAGVRPSGALLDRFVALQPIAFEALGRYPDVAEKLGEYLTIEVNEKSAEMGEWLRQRVNTVTDPLAGPGYLAAAQEPPRTELLTMTDPNSGHLYTTVRGAAMRANHEDMRALVGTTLGLSALYGLGLYGLGKKLGVPGGITSRAAPALALGAYTAPKVLRLAQPYRNPQYLTDQGMRVSGGTEFKMASLGMTSVLDKLASDYAQRVPWSGDCVRALRDKVTARSPRSKLSALLNDRRSDAEKVSILFGAHEKVAGDATDPPTLSLETFGGVFGRLLLESP